MYEPGTRNSRVAFFIFLQQLIEHGGFQSQGRRTRGPLQQARRRFRRTTGKGERRVDQLSEQRSGPRGAHSLRQGSACGSARINSPGRLLRRAEAVLISTRISGLLLFALAALLLTGCGGRKQAKVNLPPPPPISEPTPPAAP